VGLLLWSCIAWARAALHTRAIAAAHPLRAAGVSTPLRHRRLPRRRSTPARDDSRIAGQARSRSRSLPSSHHHAHAHATFAEVIRNKGLQKITVDELVEEITPRGRATVPDEIKANMLLRIRRFLVAEREEAKEQAAASGAAASAAAAAAPSAAKP
tara:strand:+ start:350 stop:817 length:468 start_codon:yes stop_codon:yes gene_type:complete